MSISSQIAKEFKLQTEQVDRIIALIEAGNTIPFIARYRKEATGNLDDQVLRDLDDRLKALRGLEARKADVLRLIAEQGQLTPALTGQIEAATTQTEIEDIYRPFRPKRRTRASLARDRGLQPLADLLLAQQADQEELDKTAGGLITGSGRCRSGGGLKVLWIFWPSKPPTNLGFANGCANSCSVTGCW